MNIRNIIARCAAKDRKCRELDYKEQPLCIIPLRRIRLRLILRSENESDLAKEKNAAFNSGAHAFQKRK